MAYLADTVLPAPDSPLTMMDWFFSSLQRKKPWSVAGCGRARSPSNDTVAFQRRCRLPVTLLTRARTQSGASLPRLGANVRGSVKIAHLPSYACLHKIDLISEMIDTNIQTSSLSISFHVMPLLLEFRVTFSSWVPLFSPNLSIFF